MIFKSNLSSLGAIACALTLFAPTGNGQSPSDAARQMLNPGSAPVASVAPVAAPSAPAATAVISAPSGYVLSPNDLVAVEVFGEEDLRTNARLNGEGNLSLPLLGSVKLAGFTLPQAAERLTELYGRDYLVNPKVNVSLIGYAKRRFTILGQVNRPGSYEMPETSPGGIDLLEAIAMAGGYTRIAAPERISIKRNESMLKVDAKRLARTGGGGFRVESGDTITVGESIF
jgi:protein involved in polysaccharide export with SLBB domain